jgi:CelD/BcsL family acetyltransferase involved in cellulose biosynthesis
MPAEEAADPAAWSVVLQPHTRHRDPDFWRAWSSLASQAPPFLRPEFFALTRPLAGEGEHFVAAAYRGGALVAALPLVRRGHRIETPRCEHAPEYDMVGDPEAVAAIWRALADEPGWDELVLHDILAASPLAVRLPQVALRDLGATVVRSASRSPYLALPGHEARLPSKLKQNLRRCARKLGGVELERIARFSRPDLLDGLAIEAMAWKGSSGTSIASSPELRHFYMALAAARRGELGLYFLRAGGRRLAFLLALEDRRNLYALKMGYDPGFIEHSPGHLLFGEVARDAEKRGLLELHFLGKDEEWKRRWTSLTRDHVDLVVYRPTARGVATLIAREIVKPRVPARTLAILSRARRELSTRQLRCQRKDLLGIHSLPDRVLDRLPPGLGIRSGVRRVLAASPDRALDIVGAPSAFAPGQWVRVLDNDRMRAALDGKEKLRGLKFVQSQWETCGKVYRVQRSVRRLLDDRGRLRPVTRTVLLDQVTCDIGGDELGCGRHCPLMYRDEWLEPAEAPAPTAEAGRGPRQFARIHPLDQIRASLDASGRREGLTFMSEMARHAGKLLPVVRRLERVYERDNWGPTRGPVYVLDGAFCTGAAVGELGPCDRACSLLWHGDWLTMEDEPGRVTA